MDHWYTLCKGLRYPATETFLACLLRSTLSRHRKQIPLVLGPSSRLAVTQDPCAEGLRPPAGHDRSDTFPRCPAETKPITRETASVRSLTYPPPPLPRHVLQEDGEKNGSKQQQRKKQEDPPEEEACPVKAIKRILRPANAAELQQLREKVTKEFKIKTCIF